MAVRIGSARIDERGKATGGKAGDQTGKEVATQAWYNKPWGDDFRAKDPALREAIAVAMEHACANNKIGYDQNQRTSLFSKVKSKGFDPAKATEACETDCSALVRVCICYATEKVLGAVKDPGNFRTATEASYLMKTGLFERLSDSDHTKSSTKLARGDILCTKAGTSGHTVVVLSDGSKCDAVKAAVIVTKELCKGAMGESVRNLQYDLIMLGYECGYTGADGDFGNDTEKAVKAFQKDHGLEVDGVAGEKTLAAIDAEKAKLAVKVVRVTGNVINVRKAPSKTADVIGYARKDTELPYQGQETDGFYLVEFMGRNGWVSGKYAEVK